MKQTRNQWAIIALFLIFSSSLPAQTTWTPLQKELFGRIVQLLISAKKTSVQAASTTNNCVYSNEITITVVPCGEDLKKRDNELTKPIQ
jgi:flagellar biosynthesis regulator FlaF